MNIFQEWPRGSSLGILEGQLDKTISPRLFHTCFLCFFDYVQDKSWGRCLDSAAVFLCDLGYIS